MFGSMLLFTLLHTVVVSLTGEPATHVRPASSERARYAFEPQPRHTPAGASWKSNQATYGLPLPATATSGREASKYGGSLGARFGGGRPEAPPAAEFTQKSRRARPRP